MTTTIVLDDGRVWGHQNWAFDSVIEAIAAVIGRDPAGQELSAWLLDQRCAVQGPGIGHVDTRELSPDSRARFCAAIPSAFAEARGRGGAAWHDPAAFPRWLDAFDQLVKMVESIARGELPEALTSADWTCPMPPTDKRCGPGW